MYSSCKQCILHFCVVYLAELPKKNKNQIIKRVGAPTLLKCLLPETIPGQLELIEVQECQRLGTFVKSAKSVI